MSDTILDVLSNLGSLYLDLAYKEMEEGSENLSEEYAVEVRAWF